MAKFNREYIRKRVIENLFKKIQENEKELLKLKMMLTLAQIRRFGIEKSDYKKTQWYVNIDFPDITLGDGDYTGDAREYLFIDKETGKDVHK